MPSLTEKYLQFELVTISIIGSVEIQIEIENLD